jgi:hypothetical protein
MPPDLPDNDVTVYLVLNDYRTGLAYVETALDEADLETIIRNFIAGEYDSALRVVAFNAAEGWSRDVSEDIAGEIIDRAYDADETFTEGTKHFHGRQQPPPTIPGGFPDRLITVGRLSISKQYHGG